MCCQPDVILLITTSRAYLPDEGLDATGTTVDLVEGDLADDLVAVLPAMHCQWLLISKLMLLRRAPRRSWEHTCGAS